jgi:hypothetical protein
LVPIPSARRTVRRRGFDATASMARLAARRLRLQHPVVVRSALAQARRVADQAGLGAAARRENLGGAYRMRRPIMDGSAVLVDDLVTTGSSLTEAARVLRAARIPVLGAATVAATIRRTAPQSPPISGSGGPMSTDGELSEDPRERWKYRMTRISVWYMALAHQGDFRSGRTQGALSAFVISGSSPQRGPQPRPNAGRMLA